MGKISLRNLCESMIIELLSLLWTLFEYQAPKWGESTKQLSYSQVFKHSSQGFAKNESFLVSDLQNNYPGIQAPFLFLSVQQIFTTNSSEHCLQDTKEVFYLEVISTAGILLQHSEFVCLNL